MNWHLTTAEQLAEAIRARREELGKTQFDLAVESGISLGQVQNIEQGATANPGYFTVKRIERALERLAGRSAVAA